jgi:Cd2+/Zn2+-exporting ATPase
LNTWRTDDVGYGGERILSAQTELQVSLLLPQGDECDSCVQRLQHRVQDYRGIEAVEYVPGGDTPRIRIHYDPNLISLDYVRALANEEGAHLAWRYQHETVPVEGMDCADCARTLESGVGRLDGVLWSSANFAAATMDVEYDADQVDRAGIVTRIRALGYDVAAPGTPEELIFQVEGLDCADCALHLEEALGRTDGVAQANVDFALARARITPVDGAGIRPVVEQVAEGMGYSLHVEASRPSGGMAQGWRERLWRRRRDLTTVLSGGLIALGVLAGLAGLPEPVTAGLFVAAIVVGGFYIARAGWAALHNAHSLDMNALMTIAAVGAVLIGEWTEGAVAMFLFSLGNTLEGYTMDRARKAIRGLMDLSPRGATVIHGDHEEQVPVEDLLVGDRILVRPGERIPMDGILLSGASAVNQAPITGESVPVEKTPGDDVYAGSINGQGALTVRVTRLAADTTIARIIRMVEEAQAQKAPSQRFVDRFARVYTPAVIAIAAAVALLPPLYSILTGAGTFGALFGEWFYRALVLLVIACPCALVISTPVSIVSAIASAARSGVLIKGGAHLESLGSLKVMAFDKTGTLTIGQPRVVAVRCVEHSDGHSWAECAGCTQMLVEAAAVERRSYHPLARAVVHAAEQSAVAPAIPTAEAVEALAGLGVRGRLNGHTITVGRHTLIHEDDPELAESPLCEAVHRAEDAGQTVMVVRDDCCGVRGYIAVADTLRPDVPGVMAALGDEGIRRTVMLTGDNGATGLAIASEAGVDQVQANLLPEQKVAAIEALLDEYEAVAMVGDGVNDAPALARATVGIAMGAAGTDAALETADIALIADDLTKLPFAVRLSRHARSVIIQNIVLSLVIKGVFFGLALAGVATLWMAVFADMGASLLVTLNGMRLLREK